MAMRIGALLSFVCLGTLGCSSSPVVQPSFVLEVDAGEYDRYETVVELEFPDIESGIEMVEITGGLRTPIPAQLDSGPPSRLFFLLIGETPRDTIRRFQIYTGMAAGDRRVVKPPERFSIFNQEGEFLELRSFDRSVLRYNYGLVQPPDPEISKLQARNAYLHPVWSPGGSIVTDDFNPDHLHQRGIWYAWTSTEFEGRQPDFWNLGEGKATVRFAGFEGQTTGPVFALIRAKHRHIDLSAPDGEKEVLSEDWKIRCFAVGGRRGGYYMFDVESVQRLVADSPLKLSEYHYGGMAFRGAREWTPERVKFLTSEGKDRIEGDNSRADWCVIGGVPGDRMPAGAAILSHPSNIRSPQPLRIHPEMPYLAFSPVRLGEIVLQPGDELVARYRFLVFDGVAGVSQISPYWADFASPPKVTLQPVTAD